MGAADGSASFQPIIAVDELGQNDLPTVYLLFETVTSKVYVWRGGGGGGETVSRLAEVQRGAFWVLLPFLVVSCGVNLRS